ncbi:MAG: redox-regulated ATPase YchF [bacterium]
MSLSVGIVGLPNVGKSTLFNALLAKQQAYVANYPFATIEPNVGIVPVPDDRLPVLAEIVKTEKIVPATVRFVDIAGLVKGASQGEGLGNKFLSHIREASVIAHVVRVFKDEKVVKEGMVDPKSDFETIKTELELADLEMIEKSEKKSRVKTVEKASEVVLPLLAQKPSMIVLNVGEEELKRAGDLEREHAKLLGADEEQVVAICAKVEEELTELNQEERGEYLSSLGVYESGLVRLIKKAYTMLGLMSYLTAGEKEVRAWTIKQGMKAPQAAGVIHTDFEKKFIAAKVCSYADFVEYQGWKGAAEKGKVRTEGKEYEMREGDTVEFMIGS